MSARFEVRYGTAAEFLDAYDGEMANGGLLVRTTAGPSDAKPGEPCTVTLRLGTEELELDATVALVRRFGVSLAFDGVPGELEMMADRVRAESGAVTAPAEAGTDEGTGAVAAVAEDGADDGAAHVHHGTLAQKLAELTVPQKLALALKCDRETRITLLRDVNKTVHVYVLKNPRTGLDEVQWAAKQTTLSPDALKLIAEHPDWGHNATVCAALVRNPRTPMPIATRLLTRLATSELKAIAKGGARDQLVQAARKLIHH